MNLKHTVPLLVAMGLASLVVGCAVTDPGELGQLTSEISLCNNGVCESGETCASCPGDCGRCTQEHCGNGVCGRKESCATCERDCGVCNNGCGNGVCSAGESCASCPSDCGRCSGEFCGNGVCARRESCTACLRDCCPQCSVDADCPASGNSACGTTSCVDRECHATLVAAGTAAGTQTAGDCQQMQCDGAGNLVSVDDNADVPDDGNPCTSDQCVAGVPVHSNAAAGTSCDSTKLCDGSGNCVDCLQASDCPAGTECSTAACTNGTCGYTNAPFATALSSQTAGDCHQMVCDGNGGTLNLIVDTDVPDDGNPCTYDYCLNGTPTHSAVPSNTPCGEGAVCDGGGNCVTP